MISPERAVVDIAGTSYPQESKNISHAMIGRAGKMNCLVAGNVNESNNSVAASVFMKGPGCGRTDSEKTPTTANSIYCAS